MLEKGDMVWCTRYNQRDVVGEIIGIKMNVYIVKLSSGRHVYWSHWETELTEV